MEDNLIVIRQLPVIEERMQALRDYIEQRTQAALSMECTEETYRQVKKARAELNKEFKELDARRKEVKAQVMAPYEAFEKVFKENASDIYRDADTKLGQKIAEVEGGLKAQKEAEVQKIFEQYRAGFPELDFVTWESLKIKVNLSDSISSLQSRVAEAMERIIQDLQVINSREDAAEVLLEYRKDRKLARAITEIEARHAALEAERERRKVEAEADRLKQEQLERVKKYASPEVLQPPKEAEQAETPEETKKPETEPPAAPQQEQTAEAGTEKTYRMTFTVTGTINQLKALKNFMIQEGIAYESA